MNAFDDPPNLDVDRLLNDLYALQASLSMIIRELAQTRSNAWNPDVLNSMVIMHKVMQMHTPSMTRH